MTKSVNFIPIPDSTVLVPFCLEFDLAKCWGGGIHSNFIFVS